MLKPTDYHAVRLWGKLLGSFDYYITAQQERAARDQAPVDAIYYCEREKRWNTIDDVRGENRRLALRVAFNREGTRSA